MKINRIHLLAVLCAAPVAAHAGLDIGINIGIPAGQGEVIIRDEPPAPREEIIGRPPAPGYVWIHGHWQRHHERWEWISGHWEAPREHMVWVEGHWDHRHGGFVWVEGRWDPAPVAVVVQAPPPAVVVETQPQAPVQQEVIVTDAPPPPRQEVIRAAPAPGYVWIQGHWQRHHDRWEWISGHWEAPHDHMVWVEGRWDRRHGGYVWVEGHWDAMQAPVTVVTQPQSPVEVFVNEAPPPPRHERIYPAPGPDYLNWQGRWVWISGRYERHPHYHPGAAWIDGHWENRRGGFVWIEGSWR